MLEKKIDKLFEAITYIPTKSVDLIKRGDMIDFKRSIDDHVITGWVKKIDRDKRKVAVEVDEPGMVRGFLWYVPYDAIRKIARFEERKVNVKR